MDAEAAPGVDPQAARRAANRRKVREDRQRLRAQGMRPIQIWEPDLQSTEQAFIDSVTEWPDDETSH
jgi:hypothetical protein